MNTEPQLPPEGVWRDDLQCFLQGVVASLPEHEVQLLLGANQCASMSGAIRLALALDPDVVRVLISSGGQPVSRYALAAEGWRSHGLPRPAPRQ